MKKQTLLGAAALTTLALAGAANAGELSAIATTNGNETVSKAVVLAGDFTAATTSAGVVGLNWEPSVGAILPSGNAILTVNLVGGAVFSADVGAGAVLVNGTCNPTTTVSEGGAEGEKSVKFLVSNLGGCNNAAANNLQFELPIELDGSASAVNVEAGLKTELGTPIDGGMVSTYDATGKINLIDFDNALSVKIVADTNPTYATLVNKFTTLSPDVTLGTAEVKVAALVKGIDDVTKLTAQGDVTKAVFTAKGDFTNVDVSLDATKFAESKAGSGTATVTLTNPTAVVKPITVAATGATPAPAIKASQYNVAVALTAAGYKAAALTIGATSIETLTREGASYLLPWVASGALSATSTSNTVVRISNVGAAAVGPVSLELLTSSTGVAASTTLVPVATSIAKGGEVVLTSASIQTALGADFGRGDVRVTVEGSAKDLIVRRFVQSTVNGALSEVSLGRNSSGTEPTN